MNKKYTPKTRWRFQTQAGAVTLALVIAIGIPVTATDNPPQITWDLPGPYDLPGEPGTGGQESDTITYRDGRSIETTCGFLASACAGAGVIVIDLQETFTLSILGFFDISTTVGFSVAAAGSAGGAAALPTASVWVRGWAEFVGSDYDEYLRNGFVEGGSSQDQGCFNPVPGGLAICQDSTDLWASGGGECVRAMAQAKATSLVESAVAQSAPTELYAAAETKDTCLTQPSVVDTVVGLVSDIIAPSEQDTSASSLEVAQECHILGFDDWPGIVQESLWNLTVEHAKHSLDFDGSRIAAENGGLRETVHYQVVEALVGVVEDSLLAGAASFCFSPPAE